MCYMDFLSYMQIYAKSTVFTRVFISLHSSSLLPLLEHDCISGDQVFCVTCVHMLMHPCDKQTNEKTRSYT